MIDNLMTEDTELTTPVVPKVRLFYFVCYKNYTKRTQRHKNNIKDKATCK